MNLLADIPTLNVRSQYTESNSMKLNPFKQHGCLIVYKTLMHV